MLHNTNKLFKLHFGSNSTDLKHSFLHFFHHSTVLVGLGLLTVEASSPHIVMDYTGLLYMLVASKFTSSF
jgi:hypothetical protein